MPSYVEFPVGCELAPFGQLLQKLDVCRDVARGQFAPLGVAVLKRMLGALTGQRCDLVERCGVELPQRPIKDYAGGGMAHAAALNSTTFELVANSPQVWSRARRASSISSRS